MVVMSVWKSFVATNPDALRYFTIYNWRHLNRNVIVKYALRYFTITCTGKDQALPLQLACTITAALQLTAMLWLNTPSTIALLDSSEYKTHMQGCKLARCIVYAPCTLHCTVHVHGGYRLCNLTPNPIKFCQQINR